MSAVIYARVPDALKQALDARASERGLSLTATVVELLEQGLQASDKQQAEALTRELAACTNQLGRAQARLAQAEARLETAREQEKTRARTHRALAERARHQLAVCPQCRQPLRGCDLLVSGHCPNCQRGITNLLTPKPQTGAPDKDEYLALLGALGGLVGLALADSPA